MARLTISCVVRRFCLECQGNSSKAVRECADAHCALWEHRLPPQNAHPQGELMTNGTPTEHSADEPILASPTGFAETANSEKTKEGAKTTVTTLTEGTLKGYSNLSHADTSHSGAKAREAARRLILRAVRRHCLTCAACRTDVRTCNARECGLWSYRFGVYPETYRAVRQRFSRPKTLSLF